jgi:O-antigen ligase
VIAKAPHNLFLGTLYDHGVIGLLLLTLTLVVLAVSLIKGIRRTTGDQRMLFVTALATLAGMLVQAIESNEIWNQSIGIYFWIVMSLPFALCWSIKRKRLPVIDFDQKNHDVEATELRMKALQLEEPKQITHSY